MKLALLAAAPAFKLPPSTTLFRVQRTVALRGSVTIGTHLHVTPPGIMAGRFDLVQDPVGYFGATIETVLYETMVRRAAAMVSLAALAQRSVVTLRTTQALDLFDLRPHAGEWPALQSPRYAPTWELADDIARAGHDGIVYRSAQQDGATCFALFGASMHRLTGVARVPLVSAAGALHAAAARAVVGAQVVLVP